MTYEETEKPQLKSDEVLVAVKAAGICGSDIPRAFVTGAHVHPIIIGHELERMWMRNGRVNQSAYFL